MGATGMYSAFVNVNPAWMLEYYEACRAANWKRAFELQDEACTLLMGLFQLKSPNLQDTALDRLLGQLGGFLECPLEGKPPYRSGTKEDLRRWRAWVQKKLPHVLRLH